MTTRSVTIGIVCMVLLAGFVGIAALLPLNAAADGNIKGEIAVDTTWTKANSPYYLEGDVHIPLGVTLTIEAGVEVYVNGSYNFWVDGNLTLAGTAAETVNMTSNQTTPAPGDWGEIRINTTGNFSVDHAIISFQTFIHMTYANHIRIENLTLHNSSSYGIWLEYCNFFVFNNLYFEYTGNDALYIYYSDYGNLTNYTVWTNYRGMYCYDSEYFNIDGYYVRYADQEPIYMNQCDDGTVSHLFLYGRSFRIYYNNCDRTTFSNSDVQMVDTSYAVYLEWCESFTLDNVSIVRSQWYSNYGLYISYCMYGTFKDVYIDMSNYNIRWGTITSDERYYNHTWENCFIRTIPVLGYNEETNLVLDNPVASYLFLFKCHNARISNITINYYGGVYIFYSNDVSFKDSNITQGYYGILMIHSDRATWDQIETYQSGSYGVYIYYSDYLNVTNSKFNNIGNYFRLRYSDYFRMEDSYITNGWNGLYFEYSRYAVLKNNMIWRFQEAAFRVWGSTTKDYYNHTIDTSNTVDGYPMHYYFEQEGISLSDMSIGDLTTAWCQNVDLDNVDVMDRMDFFFTNRINITNWQKDYNNQKYFYGIYGYYSNIWNITNINCSNLRGYPIFTEQCWWVNITDSEFYHYRYGIRASGGRHWNVSNNEFIDSDNEPLYMSSCYYSIVENNYFYLNDENLYFSGMDYLTFTRNRIIWTTNDNAVEVYSSDNCRFENNVIDRSNWMGLYFSSSHYNNITGNFFNNSADTGLYLTSCTWFDIWHNGFILNAISAYDDATTNVWWNETLLEGNLWSDYTGVDTTPQDGIGDTPYDLDGDTFDDYPLMDPFPPSVVLISPANNSFITPGVIAQFAVTDFNTNTVEYWVDTVYQGSFDPPYQVDTTGWSEGMHSIQVYADDTVGNQITNMFYLYVDTMKPTIVMTAPGNNSFVNGDVEATFSITDTNLDISSITLSIDGGPHMPYSAPFNVTINGTWSQGLHVIEITAFDQAGNGNTAVFLISLDNTIPVIELNSPADGSTIEAGDPIDFSVSDNALDYAEFSVNGGGYKNLGAPFDVDTSTLMGDIAIDIRAFDKAGNTNSGLFNFKVQDGTNPAIVLFSPADKSVIKPGTILNFDVLDNALDNVTVKIDSAANAVFPAPYDIDTTGWTTGTHAVVINANDVSGNTAQKTFTFYADEVAPTIGLISPTGTTLVSRSTKMVFDVQDNYILSSAMYRVNGWVWRPMPNGFVLSGDDFAEGLNTVDIKAVDSVGNEAVKPFEFELDSTKPLIELVSPPNGGYVKPGDPIRFLVTDANLASVFATADGANGTVIADPFVVETTGWAEGMHKVVVEAKDSAGNIAVVEWVFHVDTTLPEIIYTLPDDDATGVNLKVDVEVKFSEIMAPEGNITVAGASKTKLTWTGDLLSIDVGTLESNTTYTVTLAGLKDAHGNALPTYEFEFTTIAEDEGTGDDDEATTGGGKTDHKPLADPEDEVEREETKVQKNMSWVALIAIVLAAILVIILLFRMSLRWRKEDSISDDAIWKAKYQKKEEEMAAAGELEEEYDDELPEEDLEPDMEEPEVLEGEPIEDEDFVDDFDDEQEDIDEDFEDEVVEPPPPLDEEDFDDDGLLPPPEVD